ncbi:PAS domain-containing sensor histidine kinase [Paludibacterium yongneupense]|uniref:PAS domain-containing sensor histidine kinase n=1 Tax=Paludibacterium yongneupense TaxID=400061 RepID=UPI000413F130|nr:PAS domain-containing sensor histidine kinase [Paludibacterium yongneupense]
MAELDAGDRLLGNEIEGRRQAEAYLRQVKAFTDSLICALSGLSLEMSREGRCLDVFARTPERLGVEKEALLGQAVHGFFSADSAAILMSAIGEAEVSGYSFGQVLPIPLPLATCWFELSIVKHPGGDSGKGSFIVLFRDIHECRHAENVQPCREHEFRTLAENLPYYIVRYDRQGRKTYLNRAALSLSAHELECLIGQTPDEARIASATSAWAKEIACALQRVLQGEDAERIEIPLRAGSGGLRTHSLCFVPERAPNGAIDGALLIGCDITERKDYEQSLLARAESGQHMLDIAENLPGFVYTFRSLPEGNFSFPYVSPRIREAFGLQPGELAKDMTSFAALVPQEYQALVLAKIEDATREMSSFSCTFLMNVPRRGERWISACSMPHQEADGSVLWYGVMIDVTEQWRLEQQLELKRFALDRAHEAFYLIERGGRLVYVNEEACRALGYSRDALLRLNVSDIDPGLAPEEGTTLSSTLVCKLGTCFESRHRRRDGSTFPVEIRSSLFEWHGQAFAAALVRDISEEKRVKECIAIREREFRTLAQSLPDNILRYDCSGAVTYANIALERTLGTSAADLIGKGIRDRWSDGRYDVYAEALDSVLATGLDREIEIFVPDPRTPSDHVHQIRFVAERDETGAVTGALAIGRDISELKRIERQLLASRSQLRGLVARREEDLEGERKRIAREVHDELGQLLTGLQMKLSRLVRKQMGKVLREGEPLQEALELSEKALSVARNVASALRPAVLDMGIISALEWLAERFSVSNGIACYLRIIDTAIHLNECQAIALFRITQESLTNISRHARAGRVDITLNRSVENYLLKICDNGIGFDSATSKPGSFGLIGIQERALMLGGTVGITSSVGCGTEIAVRIPIEIEGRGEYYDKSDDSR